MDTALCLEALHKAKARAGCVPDIFNTDQGSQFTSEEWTSQLTNWGVKISMDGRGRWIEHYNTWRPHAALSNNPPHRSVSPSHTTDRD